MLQRVLTIDDSEAIHALVNTWLADEPIETYSAYAGHSGVKLAAEKKVDLILLDVDLPQFDGFQVCGMLKSDPVTREIPVIFLTGAHSTDDKIRGLELGAVDYVTKPFEPAELRARVRASLRTKFLLDLLARKAQIDGLTGLWNRAYLDQRISAELSLARRTSRALSCVLADIDWFKRINDGHGHTFGDTVICRVGEILVESCRVEDVVCRYGGEEFAILMPNTNRARALELSERCRARIAGCEFHHRDQTIPVTCSFGVGDNRVALDGDLLDAVDQALYRAKAAGRNRCVSAEPTGSSAIDLAYATDAHRSQVAAGAEQSRECET